ncbi:MAG: hypothetical protein ACYDDT_03475 [Sulfuricella sp.]
MFWSRYRKSKLATSLRPTESAILSKIYSHASVAFVRRMSGQPFQLSQILSSNVGILLQKSACATLAGRCCWAIRFLECDNLTLLSMVIMMNTAALRLVRLRFSARLLGEAVMPAHKSSLFHGVFGRVLHRDFPYLYTELFGNEPDDGDASLTVHPYILLAPPDELRTWEAGHEFGFELTLFGKAVRHAQACCDAMRCVWWGAMAWVRGARSSPCIRWIIWLTCMAKIPHSMIKPAMPVSLTPTRSRRAREQTNRCANFTIMTVGSMSGAMGWIRHGLRRLIYALMNLALLAPG